MNFMLEIKLKNGQTGYDMVGEYVRRYWDRNVYITRGIYEE